MLCAENWMKRMQKDTRMINENVMLAVSLKEEKSTTKVNDHFVLNEKSILTVQLWAMYIKLPLLILIFYIHPGPVFTSPFQKRLKLYQDEQNL